MGMRRPNSMPSSRVVHAIGGGGIEDLLCLRDGTRFAIRSSDAGFCNEALQAAGRVEDQDLAGVGRQDLEAVLEPRFGVQEVALVQDHLAAFQSEPDAS